MAPSRATSTSTFLANLLTRPHQIPRAANPTSRLPSLTLTLTLPSSRYRYHPTPIPALRCTLSPRSPSTLAVVHQPPSSSRRLYSTQPIDPTPLAERPDASKAVGDGDGDGGRGPQPPDYLSAGERAVFEKVKRELAPSRLEVQDISGGCGSMYAIEVVASVFKGMSVVRQHRLVNEVLREEIRGWHGVQLKTRVG